MSEKDNSDVRLFFHAAYIWILGVFVGSILGAAIHDLYFSDARRSVYLEAVERGYAREVETSAGKVFMWVEEPK